MQDTDSFNFIGMVNSYNARCVIMQYPIHVSNCNVAVLKSGCVGVLCAAADWRVLDVPYHHRLLGWPAVGERAHRWPQWPISDALLARWQWRWRGVLWGSSRDGDTLPVAGDAVWVPAVWCVWQRHGFANGALYYTGSGWWRDVSWHWPQASDWFTSQRMMVARLVMMWSYIRYECSIEYYLIMMACYGYCFDWSISVLRYMYVRMFRCMECCISS